MKTYSKNQLEKKATGIFEKYPLAQKIYATSDGQFFLDENRADLHVNGKKLSIVKIEKPITDSASDDDNNGQSGKESISIKNLKPIVEGINDTAVLNQMITDEQAGEKRVTAIKLFEARIVKIDEASNAENTTNGQDENTPDSTENNEETKLLETIEKMDSVDGLSGVKEKENTTETPRQVVLDAIETRITTLNKQ